MTEKKPFDVFASEFRTLREAFRDLQQKQIQLIHTLETKNESIKELERGRDDMETQLQHRLSEAASDSGSLKQERDELQGTLHAKEVTIQELETTRETERAASKEKINGIKRSSLQLIETVETRDGFIQKLEEKLTGAEATIQDLTSKIATTGEDSKEKMQGLKRSSLQLIETVETRDEFIKTLETKYAVASTTIEELETQLNTDRDASKQKLDGLKESSQELLQTVEARDEFIHKLEESLAEASDKIKELEAKHNTEQDTTKQKLQGLKESSLALLQTVEERDQLILKLEQKTAQESQKQEGEKEAVIKERDDAFDELEGLRISCESLQNEKEQLNQTIEEKNGDIREMQHHTANAISGEQQQEREDHIIELESQLRNVKEDLETMNTSLASMQEEKSQLSHTIEEKNADIKELHQKFAELEELRRLSLQSVDVSKTELESMQIACSTLHEEKAQLSTAVEEKNIDIKELQQQLATLEQKRRTMLQSVDVSKSVIDALKKTIKETDEEKGSMNNIQKELSEKNASLERDISSLKGATDALEKQISGHGDQRISEVVNYERKLAEQGVRLQMATEDAESTKTKVSRLEKEFDGAKSQLESEKASLQQELEVQVAEMETSTHRASVSQGELSDTKAMLENISQKSLAKIEDLSEGSKALEQERDQLLQSIAERDDAIEQLKVEREVLVKSAAGGDEDLSAVLRVMEQEKEMLLQSIKDRDETINTLERERGQSKEQVKEIEDLTSISTVLEQERDELLLSVEKSGKKIQDMERDQNDSNKQLKDAKRKLFAAQSEKAQSALDEAEQTLGNAARNVSV